MLPRCAKVVLCVTVLILAETSLSIAARSGNATSQNASNSSTPTTELELLPFRTTVLGTDCAIRVRNILDSSSTETITLLSKSGRLTKNGTDDEMAWGIGYRDCKRICGTGYVAFDFTNFQLQFTSWLLPFLALTAQLPYGASSAWKNVLTCLFAVGTPALLLYCLTLTTLYRRWVRMQFDELLTQRPGGEIIPDHFKRRVQAASYILQNCHHVPIEILEGMEGCLSSAVVLEENTHWWEQLRHEIVKRRQPLTQSLVAQTFFVVVSQVFVWIGSLRLSGDKFIGLGLSSGLVYLWMIPVVWGTYEVGNFADPESVREAISSCERDFFLAGKAAREPKRPDQMESKSAIYQREPLGQGQPSARRSLTPPQYDSNNSSTDAITAVSNNPHAQQVQKPDNLQVTLLNTAASSSSHVTLTAGSADAERQLRSTHPLYCMWLSVQGDEVEAGITMNYARFRSSRAAAQHVIAAFAAAKANMLNRRLPSGSSRSDNKRESSETYWGTREQISHYCGMNNNTLTVFDTAESSKDHPPDGFIAACAALFALCIMWGTVGAGIIIAYLTPTSGLGCYSGSILLYGILATVSFLLFYITSGASWSYCSSGNGKGRFLAVSTRVAAKFIAVAAAIWEITTTIMAYSNVFSNCWCDTVSLSRRAMAYTTIFIDTSTISDTARHVWFGGLFLSLVLCIFTSILFTSWGRRMGGA